jgi:hypothetical protein
MESKLRRKKKLPLSTIVDDYKSSTPQEVWIEGVLYNFLYGFLGAVVIVAVSLRIDMAVLISYMVFYFFLGKIVNRPKYVTDLGKFIVFPVPTALGAYVGYKLSPILINFLQ